MCNRLMGQLLLGQLLLGQLLPGQLSPQLEVDLWLVELYKFIRPTLLYIPFESNLEWQSYGQLYSGAVVAWAVDSLIRFPEYTLETPLRHP